jgi:XTP/dITP diphosphohydrolase
MYKLTLVTGNKGKVKEIQAMLPDVSLEIYDSGYPEIQADRLEEVVSFGAEWLSKRIEPPFLLDDSGLFIESLGGFPGVYSSYVFRTIGNVGILKLLEGKARNATFSTVLGYYDGSLHIFKGECNGKIAESPRGTQGFGFDPVFIPEGSEKTFAEMTVEEKNRYSHRSMAMRKFIESW